MFQLHYLLNEFTVLKNVMLPRLKLQEFGEKELEDRAMEHLKALGIEGSAKKKANQLSGCEKQHVAIARALSTYLIILIGSSPIRIIGFSKWKTVQLSNNDILY